MDSIEAMKSQIKRAKYFVIMEELQNNDPYIYQLLKEINFLTNTKLYVDIVHVQVGFLFFNKTVVEYLVSMESPADGKINPVSINGNNTPVKKGTLVSFLKGVIAGLCMKEPIESLPDVIMQKCDVMRNGVPTVKQEKHYLVPESLLKMFQ